jgi:hypothetical protein
MESVHHQPRQAERPVLITEAPVNVDVEYNRRRMKYLVMMIMRAVCVVAATLTFHVSVLLAALCIAAAAVLPWCAVLIANNRPAKQQVRFRRFLPGAPNAARQLTAPAPQPAPGPEATSDGPRAQDPRIIDL